MSFSGALASLACSSLSRCSGDIAQSREPHDGLRRQFLREFHAALVVGAVGIVEIDVRQLFGAAQRAALDLFDRLRTRARCRPRPVAPGKCGGRRDGSMARSCSRCAGVNPCDHAMMSLSSRLSSSAADGGSSDAAISSAANFRSALHASRRSRRHRLPSDSASRASSSAVNRTWGSSASAMT